MRNGHIQRQTGKSKRFRSSIDSIYSLSASSAAEGRALQAPRRSIGELPTQMSPTLLQANAASPLEIHDRLSLRLAVVRADRGALGYPRTTRDGRAEPRHGVSRGSRLASRRAAGVTC